MTPTEPGFYWVRKTGAQDSTKLVFYYPSHYETDVLGAESIREFPVSWVDRINLYLNVPRDKDKWDEFVKDTEWLAIERPNWKKHGG